MIFDKDKDNDIWDISDQSGAETWPEQQKDNDKDKYKGKDI